MITHTAFTRYKTRMELQVRYRLDERDAARREAERLAALVEVLQEENRVLRLANRTLAGVTK